MKEQCLLPCLCVCVYRNMNVIISHPTPPHLTPPHPSPAVTWTFRESLLPQVIGFESFYKSLTAASDWFLLPQVIENLTAASGRLNHIYWYCDSHRSIYENVDISWYLGTTTLCFWSLQWLPCPRMVWPEAPGETGPTTQHLLCAPSKMNSACRPPWVSGIPQVSRPTEAWRLQATSCYRDQAWSHFDVGHHGDTSPQWLGNAGAAFKIVSIQYVFC